MRIRVIQTVIVAKVNGTSLDVLRPGAQYELGNTLGAMFLAEGWAERIGSDEPALPGAVSEPVGDSARS